VSGMSSNVAPGRSDDLLGRFWPALSAPIATEVGSAVALVFSAVAGMAGGALTLVILELIMPRLRPPDGVVRIAIVIAGPPLRYVLLLAAIGKVWVSPADGATMALLLFVVLAFILPLGAFLLVQSRARAAGHASPE
jgi:hypothetical protein